VTLRRIRVPPRPDWEAVAARIGYDYAHNADGSAAWREDVCYVFSRRDAVLLRRAAETLHRLCLELVDEAVRSYASPGGDGIRS
jgi:glutathionylspermidine synthase